MIDIIAYHGTNANNEKSIIENGFKLSIGIENEQWLGDGVYFFCEGVPPEPYILAEKWSIAESWDNYKHEYSYDEYVILKVIVSVEQIKFLDLTQSDGLELFNYIRNKFIEQLRKAKKAFTDRTPPKDGHIIEKAIKNKQISQPDVIKGNFYIKFTDDRICKVQFRTPNCTILSVRNTDCIHSIEKLKKGNVI